MTVARLDGEAITDRLLKPSVGAGALLTALLALAGCGQAATPLSQTTGSGPTPLVTLASSACKTSAPQGWRIVDQNQDGTVFTVASPDGSMIASYGGVVMNGGQAAGLYGPQFRTPQAFVLYAVGVLTNQQAQFAGPAQAVGYYAALPLATATHRGYALVYRFPGADPGGYGMIMRIAIGSADSRSVGIAGAVAAATRCTAVLHPPPQALYKAPKDDHGTGESGDGATDLAGTYNAQLGTGWVHDSAGNNYNVDVVDDYHETGPDGPGYYKVVGNNVIKLQPGLD